MNKELKITLNGKPAYGLMMKYKFQNEARKIGDKFISEIVPKIDEFFESQAYSR